MKRLLALKVDERLIELIDKWRKDEPDLPTRAEAVRRMLTKLLEA